MKSKFIFCFMVIAVEYFGQNLISNPGFENGFDGWDELWTRTPSSGTADVVNTPVRSGSKAAHILHWGAEDWSFKHSGNYPVNQGEIYEYSAWVRIDKLNDWAELSVALFESDNNVIGWSYTAAVFDLTEGQYRQFKIRFIVPENAAYCWPRFIGADSCDIFIDDVEFKLIGNVGNDESFILENENILAEISLPSFSMSIQNKKNGELYVTETVNQFSILNVDSTLNSYTFFCNLISADIDLSIAVKLENNNLVFEISADAESRFENEFQFPGYINTQPGEYLIVPRAAGIILPVEEDYPFGQFSLYDWKATMPFAGVTDMNTGYMLVSDDPWDTSMLFDKPGGENGSVIRLIHEPSKDEFGYNRKFYLVFIDNGGYVEMTDWYRAHAEQSGYVKTFQQKAAENPNMNKLEGAVDFWALEHQFRNPDFIDSLIYYGVDKAIISLGGGWYNDDDLSEVIDTINARGLLSSRYDIYTDVWPPTHPELYWYRTEGYPGDVIVDKDGSLLKGWLAYLDDGTPFQGYYTCSSTHSSYARRWIGDELSSKHYNCRFIDVELSSTLSECYSTSHPATRKEDAGYRKELLNVVKNEFGLVAGSEEARDFAFPFVDFGEGTMSVMPADNAGYDWMNPADNPGDLFINYNMNPARRIPLHGLVYHDVHVPTWYTGDGLSKVPAYWDDKDLFNILYASMPLIMPPSNDYWQNNKEKFLTSANLVSAVFRSCGFSKMTDHRFLTQDKKVQETQFENGWLIAANFSGNEFDYGGNRLPSKGFFASDGNRKVFRINDGQSEYAACLLDDRIFTNPYGNEIEFEGVRTSGTVLIKKNKDHLLLSLIGDQTNVEINPALLPWPIENINAEKLSSHDTVELLILGNGWLGLNKTDGEIFYKITGDFITYNNDNGVNVLNYTLFQNFPNPFNSLTGIKYQVPENNKVQITIHDILGREIKTLVDEMKNPGTYEIVFDADEYSSGIYFYSISAGSFHDTKKMILLK